MIVFGDPTEEMETLVTYFARDPITFTFIGKEDAGYRMKDSLFDGNSIVLYKAKRLKHMGVSSLSVEVISDALGGSGTWVTSKALDFSEVKISDEL